MEKKKKRVIERKTKGRKLVIFLSISHPAE
jgi:hypothetical protein